MHKLDGHGALAHGRGDALDRAGAHVSGGEHAGAAGLQQEWLPPEVQRDAKGFVRTGPELAQTGHWSARRPPFLLETSRPGVFAAGDVRCGSVKRVASAVGEGSMAVQFVHEYLKTM